MTIPKSYNNQGTFEDYMKAQNASKRTIRAEEGKLTRFTKKVPKTGRLHEDLDHAAAECAKFEGSPEKQVEARRQTRERNQWRGLKALIFILATADVAIVLQNVSHDIAALIAQSGDPSFALRFGVILILEALIIGCLLLFKKLGDPSPHRERRRKAGNLAELREARMGLLGSHLARLVFVALVTMAIGMNIVAEVRKAVNQDRVTRAAETLAGDVTIAIPGVTLTDQGAPLMPTGTTGGFELPPIPPTAGVMLILLICHIG
ncbi:MAG: hypothetical protein ABL994_21215, partial [Verrucomicrobiales bacterium]